MKRMFVEDYIKPILLLLATIVYTLGILANGSSFVVLVKNYKEIPASRLLIGLTVADTCVLIGLTGLMSVLVTQHFTNFVGEDETITVSARCYRYFYFCSIYMTVLLSVDRYLVASRPLKLRRIKYSRLQWGMQAAVFFVAILLVLPEFLGFVISNQSCRSHELSATVITADGADLQRSSLHFVSALCINATLCMEKRRNNATTAQTFEYHENCTNLAPVRSERNVLEPLRRFICDGDKTAFFSTASVDKYKTLYYYKFPAIKDQETCYRYSVFDLETQGQDNSFVFLTTTTVVNPRLLLGLYLWSDISTEVHLAFRNSGLY